jgi:hypothetical protein
MAEDKKSFLLYVDLIHTVSKMPNEKAGELFKHILSYVNDENPVTEDLIVQLTFEPIRQQLKRDLKVYQKRCEKNRDSVNARWSKRKEKIQTNTNVYERIKADTKNTDIDNDTDNDNDKESIKENSHALKNSNLFRQPKIPSYDQVEEKFYSAGGTKEQAARFFAKHDAVGWFLNGSPITNFINLIPGFISTWDKNEKNATNFRNAQQPKGGKSAGANQLLESLRTDLSG